MKPFIWTNEPPSLYSSVFSSLTMKVQQLKEKMTLLPPRCSCSHDPLLLGTNVLFCWYDSHSPTGRSCRAIPLIHASVDYYCLGLSWAFSRWCSSTLEHDSSFLVLNEVSVPLLLSKKSQNNDYFKSIQISFYSVFIRKIQITHHYFRNAVSHSILLRLFTESGVNKTNCQASYPTFFLKSLTSFWFCSLTLHQ